MNIYYNSMLYIIIATAVIMSIMIHNSNLLEKEKKKQFIMLFLLISLGALGEWFGVLFNTQGHSIRILHIIARTVDHSVAPLLALILIKVVKKHIPKWIWTVVIIHGVLELLSGKFGFIYNITDDGIYEHGSFYVIFIAVYFFTFIYFLLEYLKFAKVYQRNNAFLLLSIVVFMVVGACASLVVSDLHIGYICVSIATVMLYNYYTEIIECTDVLTGLLNRRCYEAYVGHLTGVNTIFLFDVDDFKNINDTYGHEFGDITLKRVGDMIRSVYQKYGTCYRIGGDEFAVIAPLKIEDTMELNKQFFECVETSRRWESRLPFVSVGYALLDTSKTDFDSAVKEADQNMYDWKVKNKFKRKQLKCE